MNSEAQLKELLRRWSDVKTGIMEGWQLFQGRFNKIQLLTDHLVSMFPNTATVELDFSTIGAEKNVYRQSLTEFSLKGILHAKQFETLQSMSTKYIPF